MKSMIAMTSAATSPLLVVDFQTALSDPDAAEAEEPPSAEQLNRWARTAYLNTVDSLPLGTNRPCEVTIRLVDEDEIIALNRDYRGKDKATNVLSFPLDMDADLPIELSQEIGSDLLGDIVICHGVIVQEAKQQNKTLSAHYAHMVTHGILHLCGYDHQDERSAAEMELLETRILAENNIANPYQ